MLETTTKERDSLTALLALRTKERDDALLKVPSKTVLADWAGEKKKSYIEYRTPSFAYLLFFFLFIHSFSLSLYFISISYNNFVVYLFSLYFPLLSIRSPPPLPYPMVTAGVIGPRGRTHLVSECNNRERGSAYLLLLLMY